MNTPPTAAATAQPRPFKAARSYGPADGDLFYGRDAEGASLAQFMAHRPLAVVTAPSGMGKTSLLHAKVLPLLEREGWLTVYARPRDDPSASLKAALAQHLLPDPRLEAGVLERLASAASAAQVSPLLADALAWHAGLPLAERIAVRLFAPPEEDEYAALPMVSRALRGSIELNDLIEHFEALVADGPALGLTPQTPLHELGGKLRNPLSVSLWEGWCAQFAQGSQMAHSLGALEVDWAPLRPGLTGVVLVIDQFEELFTQLMPGAVTDLLGQVGHWLRPADAQRPGALPVRVALSLRKEFYADLMPHLYRFGAVEMLTFFLGALPADQARSALTRPAALFGLTFTPPLAGEQDCVIKILTMAVEDGETFSADDFHGEVPRAAGGRYAPVMISLIGAHLWSRLQETPKPVCVSWEDFQRLVPQLDDVFSSFLDNAMAEIDHDAAQGHASRFDALELLDRLVTSTGFRNIIAEVDLIEQLPLQRETTRRLLDTMDHSLKLIRRESRRGGYFVEIMHERLIAPVRHLLADAQRRDPVRAILGAAHTTVRLLADEPDATKDSLPAYLRETLVIYLGRLELDHLATKNLLRSVLWAGPDGEGRSDSSGEQRSRWQAAVVELAGRLPADPGQQASSGVLLTGDALDTAIDGLLQPGMVSDSNRLRHVAVSALADRTPHAGSRIRRIFGSAALSGATP